MADEADDRWTVRGVPKAYRERAAKDAGRLELTLGAYLCQALDLRAQAEREPFDLILPTADKAADMADTAELERLERLVASIVSLAGARGVPVATRRVANDLLRERLERLGPVQGSAPLLTVRRAPANGLDVVATEPAPQLANGARSEA